ALELEFVLLDGRAEPFGEHARVRVYQFGAEDGEFLAAVARDDVDLAGAEGGKLGDLPQHEVASAVPVGVVAGAEMIDVEEQQRERTIVAAGAAELAVEGLVEITTVEHLRQTVGGRQSEELFVVCCLDVGAGYVLEDCPADPDAVTIVQVCALDRV